MAIALDTASLISLLTEAILFGLLTALVAVSVYLMISKRHIRPLRYPIVIVAVTMLVFGLVHLATDMQRILNAFIRHRDDPVAYLNSVSDPLYVLKSAFYVMQTLLGDGFVIYRLYIIWGCNKWMVVFPLTCLLGSCVIGIHIVVQMATLSPTTPVFELKNWISSFFSLTLFTNFICTALIAFKIWWIGRSAGQWLKNERASSALIMVVESGAIYSASLITLLATYLSGSWSQYILLDGVVQIIGVVFTLIIARIALGHSSEETGLPRVTLRSQMNVRGVQVSSGRPVEVQMTTYKQQSSDSGILSSAVISVGSTTSTAVDSAERKKPNSLYEKDVYSTKSLA
ncbi:hypothetical protein SCHPADRAFT_441469 [Schizopora paradoxa]|uniref:Uncharacterized protein n=1 Tax=Schizopora paradoxa TaxID=27342 RepID=A0A0H2RJ87_9AGAM|nr:hypothetical protein SCHPADRAFT_441469 [Schizopora paradoxa]